MRRAAPAVVLAITLGACTSSPSPSASPPSPSPAPASAAVRYVALGDSFTIGTGGTPDRSFPARLAAAWPCPSTLLNAGVDGFTTDDVIAVELPQLAGAAPTIATLLVGANDIVHGASATTYRAHLETIFRALDVAHVARVVALPQPDWSVAPVARLFGDPAALHAKIVAWNGVLRDEAAAFHREYVDLFPLMEEEARAGMFADDHLHPNGSAYAAWADALGRSVASPCRASGP